METALRHYSAAPLKTVSYVSMNFLILTFASVLMVLYYEYSLTSPEYRLLNWDYELRPEKDLLFEQQFDTNSCTLLPRSFLA